ncbi:MAG: RES domain-containing protein, partial [candidate division Zixibacteria bacterium]
NLSAISRDMPFLILLGEELSKPFEPQDAELEYLPSQYLCEYVKSIKYEGIAYRSSIARGYNFAFFQENKLKKVSTSNHRIDEIDVSYSVV